MSRLAHLWMTLRSSLWFAPSLLVLAAVVLAGGLIELDLRVSAEGYSLLTPLLTSSPEGARATLAAIAGSMITVAGVVFSITIVTLSLASSQYSPRVLRGFMKDPTNQVVLGVFVGIFTYCIVVLGAIRTDAVHFVPSLAVFGGAGLSLVGIGFLIHFIHHTANAIQASNIIAAVAAETLVAIDRNFHGDLERDTGRRARVGLPDGWSAIGAPRNGFVQRLDGAALTALAIEERLVIRSERRVGEFVVEGSPLASVSGVASVPDGLRTRVRRAYTIGHQRTVEQDPEWGMRQLVDIASRALSPGINDATTAVTCLHYLAAIVIRLSRVELPPDQVLADGQLRLIIPPTRIEDLVALAFGDVRTSASGNPTVLRALVDALDEISSNGTGRVQVCLLRELDAATEAVRRTVLALTDRDSLLVRSAQVRAGMVRRTDVDRTGAPQSPEVRPVYR